MQRFYFSNLSHRRLLFFIRSRSPLRALTKNKSLRHDSRKLIASYFIEPTIKEMDEENTLFRCIQKEENYKYVPFWKTFSSSKISIYFKIKH